MAELTMGETIRGNAPSGTTYAKKSGKSYKKRVSKQRRSKNVENRTKGKYTAADATRSFIAKKWWEAEDSRMLRRQIGKAKIDGTGGWKTSMSKKPSGG